MSDPETISTTPMLKTPQPVVYIIVCTICLLSFMGLIGIIVLAYFERKAPPEITTALITTLATTIGQLGTFLTNSRSQSHDATPAGVVTMTNTPSVS